MKRNLLIMGILTLFTFIALAENLPTIRKDEIEKHARNMLLKSGIDIPISYEIRLVSANKYLSVNRNEQNPNVAHMALKIKQYQAMHEEQQRNGFVKESEPRAEELMTLKHVAPYHKKKYREVISSESTHIRGSKDELKLAYTFIGVPKEEMTLNIGLAPYGAFKSVKNGDDGDGWDGAVQFFEKNGIGSCAYTEHNRKLAHSGVELIKELVTYDVDTKPSLVLVRGNHKTGFLYKVQWYDNIFSRELECANQQFSWQLRLDVIALANRIESYQKSVAKLDY